MSVLLFAVDSTINGRYYIGRLVTVFILFAVTQLHPMDAEKRAATLYIVLYMCCSVIFVAQISRLIKQIGAVI